MNIQKKTYVKLWVLCLSSLHNPRKSELITHRICIYRKNSGRFTHFLIMAFQTLWLAEMCSGCEISVTFSSKTSVQKRLLFWEIFSTFFSRWECKQRPVLWIAILMSAFNQHLNVWKFSKSPHYHIYENPFSGFTVVMSYSETYGEANKLRTR